MNMNTVRQQSTILVVDDDAAVRGLAAQILESRGYDVLVAPNSASAIRTAADHPAAIHLLLTDIMMPNGNGIALAEAFLAARPGTPVLYMSGFETETIELVDGAPRHGPLLTKPFTGTQLLEQVQALVPDPVEAKVDPAAMQPAPLPHTAEAVYRLESLARCPQCGETLSELKVIRLLRTQVNFISTLPRRGRLAVCPECLAILPVELTSF